MRLWIVTVNFGETSATKSLIDSVESLKNCNSIKVGITPSGIAFNEKYNYLIVTNRDANTAEIYDSNNKLIIIFSKIYFSAKEVKFLFFL